MSWTTALDYYDAEEQKPEKRLTGDMMSLFTLVGSFLVFGLVPIAIGNTIRFV